jgi:formylmethanofuran dehydrogenase subunit A
MCHNLVSYYEEVAWFEIVPRNGKVCAPLNKVREAKKLSYNTHVFCLGHIQKAYNI